jgi:hypothetical protein
MEKLEKEERENREEYGNFIQAKLLVERDIKTLNKIFDLLIQIELVKLKAENQENNTNIGATSRITEDHEEYDSKEESDDIGFR